MQSCFNESKIELYEKYENPKLSMIIPFYNGEKYLNRLLRSIQKQKIKEIEIIFVDDCSTDNGTTLLKEYAEIDKRIIYIKNAKNKGTLFSMVRGILKAKGNHIMIIDDDEMLLSDLKYLYEISKHNDKDINDFSYIYGKVNNIEGQTLLGNRKFYQPELGEMTFNYKYNSNTYINKKIMKTDMLKNAVLTINEEILNSNIVLHGDTILFICAFYNAKSYKSFNNLFIQFHIINENSYTFNIVEKYKELFRSCFILFKYISGLKYSSKTVYNKHIRFGLDALNYSLTLCSNKTLLINLDTIKLFINSILINKDLNDDNKYLINKILKDISIKNNN